MLGMLGVCIVGVWLRNRDILRDMFDYSMVIGGVGKVEAGFRPYSGIRSPMQSSVYLLNYAVEWAFGRNYLGLTVGGLLQGLGGALLVRALLLRRLHAWAATLVGLTVAMAGLLQHMVFFYNPIGILCFSVVLLGLAVQPQLWPVQNWRTVAVYGALLLGGMNKLNFHGAALLMAGLLCLASWRSGRISGGGCRKNIVVLFVVGCLAPLGAELMWTGATLPRWYNDVVLLPGARRALVQQMFEVKMYLQPIYDYHHHLLLPQIGGLGMLVLLATGGWLLWDAGRAQRSWDEWAIRGALIVIAAGLASLLMLTNVEAVVLTSLAYPIMALGLYLHFRSEDTRLDRWVGVGLLGAVSVWGVVGGYAAWHGSRVLYAQNPPSRSEYIRLHSTERALAYLDGVRLLPQEIEALKTVAARMKSLEDSEGKLPGMLFGPALEWMARAYPESNVTRSAVWYHAGTTLRENDADYFRGILGGGTRRLVTHNAWQAWPVSIKRMLFENYRVEHLGGRDVLYHPRGPRMPPVRTESPEKLIPVTTFRGETDSNILISATRTSLGMGLHQVDSGTIFGARENTSWSWPLGAQAFQGRAIARLRDEAGLSGSVTFRVMAGDPADGDLLWEVTVEVSPESRAIEVPFSLQPARSQLWLQTVVSDSLSRESILAGWRQIRIVHAKEGDRSIPPPFGAELRQVGAMTQEKNFESIWYAGQTVQGISEGYNALPAQNWRRFDGPVQHVRVELDLAPSPQGSPDPVVVTLAWYRAGRFEIMGEKMFEMTTGQQVVMEAAVPEPTGWIGVLTRPAGGGAVQHRVQISAWEAR